MNRDPRELLESQRIVWARDWDAMLSGMILGVLVTLVLVWLAGWIDAVCRVRGN